MSADWHEATLVQAALGSVTFEYAAPNIYAFGRAESDAVGVTRARMVYEFEAKVTLADLRADVQPRHFSVKWCRQQVMSALHERRPVPLGWAYTPRRPGVPERAITDAAEWADLRTYGTPANLREWSEPAPSAPMHFYYVYPAACAEAFDALVPAYAGIAHADSRHYGARIARKAPRLHGDKAVADTVRATILASTYHRFWRQQRQIEELREQVARLAKAQVDRVHTKLHGA